MLEPFPDFKIQFKNHSIFKLTKNMKIIYGHCLWNAIKFDLKMKLSFLFLILSLFQTNANTYSQKTKISLDEQERSIQAIFNKIEKITEFKFFFENEQFRLDKKVTIKVEKKHIDEVLQILFSDTDIDYERIEKQIILTKKIEKDKPKTSIKSIPNVEKKIKEQQREVSGVVLDQNGEPLPGASIVEKGTTNGTQSDFDGNFTLELLNDNVVLEISYIGFATKEVSVNGQSTINVELQESTASLEEVVVVGYGTQKKATLTGAVSSIKSKDIVSTKNENVQNMLTGKIPGVRVSQRTAEPGSFDNILDIRGMGSPLVIIDGVPRSSSEFQRLNSEDIDNISVLKDASAAIYGVRAANGVILVTTKKGTKNTLELNYNGTFTWQIPSGLPATVDAIEYMTLRNEQAMHNINGGAPIFNEEQFEAYRNGEKQSTDWYPLVFDNYAPQTVQNISATGGNEKTTFYVGLGYQYQEGFFKSSDLTYNKYNIRSNITTKITDGLTLDLNVNLIMDEQDRPYQDSWWTIRSFWRQGPQIPAYANDDPTKPYHGLIEGDNPISFMDKDIVGSREYNKKWIQTSSSLKYDFPFLKGLYAKGLFSYDYNVETSNIFQREYKQYRYDEASDTYSSFTRQSPNRIQRDVYFKDQVLTQFSLNYDETDGPHKFSALMLAEAQKRKGDNFIAQRDLVLQLPYLFAGTSEGQLATMNSSSDALYENSNLALVGRFNYSFTDKYLVELLYRYDGSSKFGKQYQWGFFPAASLGWRISEENFVKEAPGLSFINQLKVRGSYGKTGDDTASNYQFISGYNYPSSSSRRNFTGGYVFDGNFNASADNKGIPNPFITWYTSKTLDLGIDFIAWDGLFGITADYFSRRRDGLLARKSGGIPTVVGANLPEENLNSDRTYGFDLELSHRNQIGDFYYGAKGLFSLTRVERLYVERGPIGSSWSNWQNNQNNRLQGVHRGLQGDGQFQSWEEIWSSPVYIGRGTIIGDYKYEDWNGDGEINGNDVHPIRYNQTPWINYSLIFDATFKNFDLNFLLQGSAMSSLVYGEQLRIPMWGSGESGAMEQFMDRWHPTDPNADPYDPNTTWESGRFAYTGTLPDENSTFNTENSAYVRLKSIELGYTLPSNWTNKIGIKKLRIYANAYNLLTITRVNYVDPEHPADTYGYLYPLNKTVSTGLNVQF
tara:strand:+ start:2027 stop:5557 length:3531 start_codon:yes stop_codon:yes gene_type:complete